MVIAGASTEVASLLRLHRHADGILSFAVESGDEWRTVFALRADRLETMFPEIRAYLLRDSFVSINAAYRMARGTRCSPGAERIGRPSHRTETLRYLCACYCDLDFYRKGFTYSQALASVQDAVTAGKLPRSSFLVNSGRGLWVFWLLHDPLQPAQAHLGAYGDNKKNHLLLYQRVQREINRLLAWLGADPGATDAARYVRMPASFRNDVEQVVLWEWAEDTGEPIPSYTLQGLALLLCVDQPPARASAASKRLPGKCPLRRHGFDTANRNKLAAFRCLQSLRCGGFPEGQRNIAAFILAACLKWNGASSGEALAQVEAMAQACTPPLSPRECLSVVKSAYKSKVRKMSYRWIADQLVVTAEEAKWISVHLVKPFPAANGVTPAAAGAQAAADRGSERTIRCMLRRMEIQRLVEQAGSVPSSRCLQSLLQQAGMQASHVSILADLRALGLCAQRITERQNARANDVRPTSDLLFGQAGNA